MRPAGHVGSSFNQAPNRMNPSGSTASFVAHAHGPMKSETVVHDDGSSITMFGMLKSSRSLTNCEEVERSGKGSMNSCPPGKNVSCPPAMRVSRRYAGVSTMMYPSSTSALMVSRTNAA